jgi:hypothetical protein
MKQNLIGKIYGYLEVISCLGSDRNGKKAAVHWMCRCKCGNTVAVTTAKLNFGLRKSCGCLKVEKAIINGKIGSEKNKTHNGTYTPEYKTWTMIKSRCNNPKSSGYENYGGRGIKICERWNNSFQNFLDDMGKKPNTDFCIDRINVNEGYYKDNCQWTSLKSQQNNKRTNIYIEFGGNKATLAEWATKIGICGATLRKRMKNMSIEDALTSPKKMVGRSRKLSTDINLNAVIKNLNLALNQIGRNCLIQHFGEAGTDLVNSIKVLSELVDVNIA